MSKFIFYFTICVGIIGAIFISCGNNEKKSVNQTLSYQLDDTDIWVIVHEGHTYLEPSHGGIIHAQSCKCLHEF